MAREQRQIKFRAWDKDHNKILNDIHEIWRLDNNAVLNSDNGESYNLRLGWMDGGKIGYWRDIIPKQIEFMQFTGFKDSKGVEIFEGDIIQMEDDDGRPRNAEVEFYDGSWWIGGQIEDFLSGKIEDYGIEVIGNKFQHPELLK